MRVRAAGAIAVVPAFLAACGGERGLGGRVAEADAFCRDALARVDSFLAGVDPGREDPRQGGTIVVGNNGEISDGMNALVSGDYTASQHQLFVNLMSLVRMDEELRYVPYLAESWDVSPDGTELTFHLRDDVRWHDGRPTTAYDVAFTYVRATDPETTFSNSSFWTHYVRGPDGVEVSDSLTVTLRLRPHAEYLDPWRATAIMPRHLLEDVPPARLRQHPFGTRCPVGNGPFRFVEHRQGESWTFAANPAFPEGLGGRPHADRYVYRVIPEQATLLAELLAGNIDVFFAPRPDQAAAVRAAPDVDLLEFQFRNYVLVAWNARRPQLADARVRRAITLATNRAEMVEALLEGYGRVASTGVPPYHWAYDPALADSLPHDPARARALLDEAGWVDRNGDGVRENADGLPLAFTIKYNEGNQQRRDIAEIMQSQLAAVGIRARPQVVEWGALVAQITDPSVRDFDGVVLGWVAEFKLDDTDLFHSSKADQPNALAGIRDAELDRLLDTLQVVVEREAARPVWREYQQRIIALQPYTYLFFPERLGGVSRRLRDVRMDARGEWVSVRDWWIPPEGRRRGGRVAAH